MLREILLEAIYIFTNYLVCNIPIWPVRKFLYRLMGMHIGRGSRILMKTVVESPWKISIQDHTYINERCHLDGRGGIRIGSNVTIAVHSRLITGYHEIDDDSFAYQTAPIIIDDNAVLFAGCMCLPGGIIGKGSVFAAGSVITRGVYEESCIYGGNPAKYLRKRRSDLSYVQDQWNPIFR